jgi:acyl-CoA thioesterase I
VPHRLRPLYFSPRLPLFLLSSLAIALGACTATGARSSSPAQRSLAVLQATPTEPALAPPLAGSYAALGASETYGVGAEPHTRGYAYLVAMALHTTHFVNEGIPGTTLNAAYQTELTNALSIRPSLATVFFGFNDLTAHVPRAAFLQDLHDLVITLRRARTRVLIIGLPDLAKVPAAAHRIQKLHKIVMSWNAGMRAVAQQTGGRFLDLRPYAGELAKHREYISADGLHPSNAGHARLAQVVLKAIRANHLWSAK